MPMLTWQTLYQWASVSPDRPTYPGYFHGWFWTAFLATYGRFLQPSWLLEVAAELATKHRQHPDYSVHPDERYCRCHKRPRLLGSCGGATWEGDYSAAAWYHLPLVRAYILALLAGDEGMAESYLREFGASRRGPLEAYDIAQGIGDIPRAYALAGEIVDQYPQRVYFLCRTEDIHDPELLERARRGLLADPNPLQALHCAEATSDTEFIVHIHREKAAVAR